MHLLQPGLLWLALAAAGTPATPAEVPTRTAGVDVAAQGEPGMPAIGPLRRSLERFHASLSEACPDAQPQAAAARDARSGSRDGERTARPLSCLAAAQVSGNPPPDPRTGWRWLIMLLVIGLIGWLISRI